MNIVDMPDAKEHLPRLVERAARGESFIIAIAGKPLVKVISVATTTPGPTRRLGFLKDHIRVPDDFDQMGGADIQAMFGVGS